MNDFNRLYYHTYIQIQPYDNVRFVNRYFKLQTFYRSSLYCKLYNDISSLRVDCNTLIDT